MEDILDVGMLWIISIMLTSKEVPHAILTALSLKGVFRTMLIALLY